MNTINDNRCHRPATRRFFRRPQQLACITHPPDDQGLRIQTRMIKSGTIGQAGLPGLTHQLQKQDRRAIYP